MKKRYRLVIVLIVMAVCFVFLWPTLRWYFLTPLDQQALALQTRERIRDDAEQYARDGLQRVIEQARIGGDVPEDLSFLVSQARRINREHRLPVPARWDARAVMEAFPSQPALLNAIETQYRENVFALRNLQRNAVQLGLDLSGGLSILLHADMDSLQERAGHTLTDEERNDAMDRDLGNLSSRIDRFGLTEPVIRRQGDEFIYVEIPGSADPGRIHDIIMGRGSLTFHIADIEATHAFLNFYHANPGVPLFDEYGELLDAASIPGLPADVIIRGVFEQDLYGLDIQVGHVALMREVGLDGTHIRSALVERSQLDGRPEVTFLLSPEGGEIFFQLTSANVGRPMAIVLDDRVRSQATIQTAIREAVRLTGFGMDEANAIARILREAALPVELSVIRQQSIGASMGEDTIRQGLFALLGGIVAVLIFMLAYYKMAGINAVVAQILNFYIMFSILSAFNFTLTLPSIAGFILTIGMAVDASVIIFERMKEEMRLGKGRKAVVEAGFGKAFWAVMDANITTFIAALFMSQLGSGPIQGFAVTLSVGVFSSVFTALFVSRLIFDFSTDVLRSKNVSITWSRMRLEGQAVRGVK